MTAPHRGRVLLASEIDPAIRLLIVEYSKVSWPSYVQHLGTIPGVELVFVPGTTEALAYFRDPETLPVHIVAVQGEAQAGGRLYDATDPAGPVGALLLAAHLRALHFDGPIIAFSPNPAILRELEAYDYFSRVCHKLDFWLKVSHEEAARYRAQHLSAA
ncbi:MAG TPA: hypothetical protein VLF67_05250 [Candidatus Saccharimonas sp.]|nr:hypothetical protein [Candidatus Saccharimonas sp.]